MTHSFSNSMSTSSGVVFFLLRVVTIWHTLMKDEGSPTIILSLRVMGR